MLWPSPWLPNFLTRTTSALSNHHTSRRHHYTTTPPRSTDTPPGWGNSWAYKVRLQISLLIHFFNLTYTVFWCNEEGNHPSSLGVFLRDNHQPRKWARPLVFGVSTTLWRLPAPNTSTTARFRGFPSLTTTRPAPRTSSRARSRGFLSLTTTRAPKTSTTARFWGFNPSLTTTSPKTSTTARFWCK